MLLKFLILITCSSFLRAFAEDYLMMPSNHRLYDENPYLYYHLPTREVNERPRKAWPMINSHHHHQRNNLMLGFGPLSTHMRPPSPYAMSPNYNHFRDGTVAVKEDEVPYNHRPYPMGIAKESKKTRDERPTYTREHDPFTQVIGSENEKSPETKVERKKKSKKRPTEELELSPDGDRIEFQIQGHEGPSTYIFGYDTGDGKNRQFRLEERLRDGSIKGHYGYYDARGKLRTVRYSAGPAEGYTEKHHISSKTSTEEE